MKINTIDYKNYSKYNNNFKAQDVDTKDAKIINKEKKNLKRKKL